MYVLAQGCQTYSLPAWSNPWSPMMQPVGFEQTPCGTCSLQRQPDAQAGYTAVGAARMSAVDQSCMLFLSAWMAWGPISGQLWSQCAGPFWQGTPCDMHRVPTMCRLSPGVGPVLCYMWHVRLDQLHVVNTAWEGWEKACAPCGAPLMYPCTLAPAWPSLAHRPAQWLSRPTELNEFDPPVLA